MRRLGVALGRTGAWVAPAWRGAPPTREGIRLLQAAGIEALVTEVREAVGPAAATLDIVLLPELYQLRRIALPPLSPAERRAVLERTVGRYLPAHGPWAFGAQPATEGIVIAAASRDDVIAIERAVSGAGFRLGSVRPAIFAWLAAARPARYVMIGTPARIELVDAPGGRIGAVRRLPRTLADPGTVRELVPEGVPDEAGPVSLIAHERDARMIDAALVGHVALRDVTRGLAPEALAAAFATRAGGPEIVTADTHARRERTVRRVTRGLAAIAAGLVVLAGAAGWWGQWREVRALRGARAAQAAEVVAALALRERVTHLHDRLAVLDPDPERERAWTRVLADVADHLPPGAFLTAFRAAGDSVSLEGYARESGAVLDALREAPAVAALRATAPIRREAGAGDATVDRFVLGVRLVGAGQR
jgi:hypothetical protein